MAIQALPSAPARNDFNEPDLLTDWVMVAVVWAAIEPAQGREIFYGQIISPDVTHLVTIRWNRGLGPKSRLYFQDPQTGLGRVFNIESVLNIDERNRKMVLSVKEQV